MDQFSTIVIIFFDSTQGNDQISFKDQKWESRDAFKKSCSSYLKQKKLAIAIEQLEAFK